MKSPSSTQPVLKQFASLWTLMHQPSAEKEWTLEEKIKRVKQAGFEGIGSGLSPDVVKLCKKYEMDFICYIEATRKNYRDKLEAALATRPARVNVQLYDHDTSPEEAASVWVRMSKLAKKMKLEIDLEVHRDTCTETPEKVYEIARLYQKATGEKIRYSWDFSHIAIVKHLAPPYADRLLDHPDLVQIARQFHFRPFNGHHCEIPTTDGKGGEAPEIKPYLDFIDALFTCWLKAARGEEVLYVCPEYGPVASGYGLSCFPNVWQDAISLRAKTQELWKAKTASWKRRRSE